VIAANPLNELLLYDVNESLPISSEGTVLLIGFNRSQSRPGDILRDANIKSKTLGASVTVVHPWLRSRSENLFLRGGFDYRNSKTQIGLDETTLFDDRTRALSLGTTYDLADRYFGVNLADLKFTKGFPIMAASEKGDQVSRGGRVLGEASGDFAKLNLEVSRLQRVISEVNVLVSAAGQYSFSNLLVAEQFGFGGDRYGRSYDPSEILGDHGVGAKFEVQYNPTWIADAASFVSLPPDTLRALQFYAYYDVGMVWQRAEDDVLLSAGVFAKDRDAGTSAGFGIRFNILDYLAGYVEVAKPLTRDLAAERAKNEDGKDLRYFFNLATNF
jgi:hemolysin activation/secretion protein